MYSNLSILSNKFIVKFVIFKLWVDIMFCILTLFVLVKVIFKKHGRRSLMEEFKEASPKSVVVLENIKALRNYVKWVSTIKVGSSLTMTTHRLNQLNM